MSTKPTAYLPSRILSTFYHLLLVGAFYAEFNAV